MIALSVIDDDPTGAQTEAAVPLLLEWPIAALRGREGAGAVHLLTNSRALDETEAYDIVRDATEASLAGMPERCVVLRGDSTLRGHLLPEYLAVRDAAFPDREPPLVLIPALPAAGRVTVGGIHWLVRDGQRAPIASTEFGSDRRLGYASSRLLDWADERSGGRFAAADGREIDLATVRSPDGAEVIAGAVSQLADEQRPAALVPDAETLADLAVIAEGVRAAREHGVEMIVRCAPAFVGVAAGTTADGLAARPRRGRVLVIVGSHVPTTTRQLEALSRRRPGTLVEVEAAALVTGAREAALEAAVADARERLAAHGLATVATTRDTPGELLDAGSGMAIATGLAEVLARTRDAAHVIVSKGGITSAVNVREGLGATEALVVGPLADGVALWRVGVDGGDVDLVVFPGNVGGKDALADLVDGLVEAR
jgi:uncharacterized protein YgbK (DUF1537 family)